MPSIQLELDSCGLFFVQVLLLFWFPFKTITFLEIRILDPDGKTDDQEFNYREGGYILILSFHHFSSTYMHPKNDYIGIGALNTV
jgi:hypothetical protein